jgi:hypothetical protein
MNDTPLHRLKGRFPRLLEHLGETSAMIAVHLQYLEIQTGDLPSGYLPGTRSLMQRGAQFGICDRFRVRQAAK